MAAWLIGWHTLAGGRTWTAVIAGAFVAWALPARVGRLEVQRAAPRRVRGTGRSSGVSRAGRRHHPCALVLVFGGLFAGADPGLRPRPVLDNLIPSVQDTEDVVSRHRRCSAWC